jgi:membrane-associated protein
MITDLFGIPLTDLVQAAGYLGIFAIIFSETGMPFGFIFPGDSLLFVAGLLASQGVFEIVPLLLLTTSAAILGDTVGYALGKYAGPKLFTREKGFFFSQSMVRKTEAFYARYGVRAIILSRFVPTVRTFIPMFAGVGRMRYRTFLTYNIVGALLWGTGVTYLGYALGNVFPNLEHYLLPIIIAIIIASASPLVYELWDAHRKQTRS